MCVILTAEQMRAADAAAVQAGTPAHELMEWAARAALDVLFEEFDTSAPLFVCGCGNNGGDGLVMARLFAELTGSARVCYLGPRHPDGAPDTACMSEECARAFSLLPREVKIESRLEPRGASVIVDALLGTGLSRPITGELADCVTAINRSALPVLSVDIPSGICADTGSILGVAVRATRTVSMAAYKYGQLLFPGAALCGKLSVADIGISPLRPCGHLLLKSDLDTLPPRPARAHKGTFGRVLIVGGCCGMSGAGYLSAKAAYRTGAGLVEIFCPEENRVIYQTQLPEALLTRYDPARFDDDLLLRALERADAVAIGMGLGRSALSSHMTELVLRHATVPLVLDADALNEIADSPALLRALQSATAPKCITPHVGEMSRLCGRPAAVVGANLPLYATQMAESLEATVVLKDARTVIASRERICLNRYGNSGMATGGSGDVLAGIIAALFAAGDAQAPEHGVLAHALAGDAALQKCGSHGLMASDIIDGLRQVLS